MKAIQGHTVLFLFLLISHAGISSTRSYIRNEFKNYNYLDSGEYYLDSNVNFGYLFPKDTIAKDLEIKFVKNKSASFFFSEEKKSTLLWSYILAITVVPLNFAP